MFYALTLCALQIVFTITITIRGSYGNQKIGPFMLFFSLNIMSKFRVPEMTFRGNSDTVKKYRPTVKQKAFRLGRPNKCYTYRDTVLQ